MSKLVCSKHLRPILDMLEDTVSSGVRKQIHKIKWHTRKVM